MPRPGAAAATGGRSAPGRAGLPFRRGLRRRRPSPPACPGGRPAGGGRPLALAGLSHRVRAVGRRDAGRSWPPGTSGSPVTPGALAVLPIALVYRSGTHLHAGEFAATSALIEEAGAAQPVDRRRTRSCTPRSCWRPGAARGPRRSSLLEFGIQNATDRGEGRALAWGEYASALLPNGLGEYEAALAAAQAACEHDDLGLRRLGADRAGRGGRPLRPAPTSPPPAVERLAERTQASGTEWALGIEARSRALLSEGEAADGCTARPSSGSARDSRHRAPRPRPPGVRRVAAS